MRLRLPALLFVVLLMFLGFCGGLFLGSLFVSETSGFAGPAVTFWYGVGGLLTALASGIFLVRKLSRKSFRITLTLIVIISLIICSWIVYRLQALKNQPASTGSNFYFDDWKKEHDDLIQAAFFDKDTFLPAGMGMAKPHLSHGKVIYFYHLLPIGSQPYQIRPQDSIHIHKRKHSFEIIYAPPWFYPEVMKLDYDLLYLRTITVSKDWLEVVVNRQTGQTTWIARADADFIDWPAFLLNVHSVELMDVEANPLRLKPHDHASIVATTPERFSLTPIAIQGDWLMVSTSGLSDKILPYGWIRWRKDDRLLISYSLLS
jgi:hypothetical protein